jgi:hypothetical protein
MFWPATVSEPLRVSPGFSATEKLTVPEPVWLVPEVIVTNALFEAAVHAQVLPVFTANVAVPPEPAMLKVVVEIEYTHAGAGVVTSEGRVGDFEHADTTSVRQISADATLDTNPSTRRLSTIVPACATWLRLGKPIHLAL